MTWSLRLRNGDLSLSGAQFDTVTNEEKLVQDLRCQILERMGTDSAHPEFGSLIDGGTRPDGIVVTGVIGEDHVDLVIMAIESEIQRIAKDYQGKQLARAKSDRYVYNKPTLTAREVLLAVKQIDFNQNQDTLNVTVTIQTAANGALTVDIPILTELPLITNDNQ